jgi:hypothetical protein
LPAQPKREKKRRRFDEFVFKEKEVRKKELP